MNASTEVERLRARVAELESRLGEAETGSAASPPTQRRSAWWTVTSAVLIVLACVLAPLSVASVWASAELSDTEQYVETVAPLADDPAVQQAVADEVTSAVLENLDVEALTDDALEALAGLEDVPPRVADALPALAVPISNGIESFTRDQVGNALASPQFAQVWAEVNRVAHTQVVRLLEGDQGGAVTAQDDTITLNLGPVIEQVKQRLVDRGFTLAENIPVVDRSFVLVQSEAIPRAQGFYSTLNTLGAWLPLIALGLLAVGVLLAKDRRRALLRGALGVTASMLVLAIGLILARTLYVDSTPANILTPDAAGGVFDTMVRFLRTALRALAVLGLVVALAAFMTGPSSAAARTRDVVGGGIANLRSGAEGAGLHTGRLGTWTHAHRRVLRIVAVTAGALFLMFATRPTGWLVVGTALVVLVALAVIEFLATPPTVSGEEPQPPQAEVALPLQVQRSAAEEATSVPAESARAGTSSGKGP